MIPPMPALAPAGLRPEPPPGRGAGSRRSGPTLLPVRRSSPVPVEFIGRARTLRDRVAKAHLQWTKAAAQLTAPLLPRGDFTPIFTRQTLAVTAARWRKLPQWGRLRPTASTITRDRVAIGELRLIQFRSYMTSWGEDELAVAITAVSVTMAQPSTFKFDSLPLALIGLHALARRYGRGADRRDLAVIRDLLPIIPAAPGILRDGGECEIPTSDGGRWIGSRMGLDGKPVVGIRTFVA
jgi:hypothetical protein